MALILADCTVFDGVSHDPDRRSHIYIENARIREIADRPFPASDLPRLSVGGRFVMPGLIDAHFHSYGTHLNPAVVDKQAPGTRALAARRILEDTLRRGFTTVRDAAGGDYVLASALASGLIDGPRLFYPGLALSQTGGHGDLRAPDHFTGCACAYCGAMSVIADGPDDVRRVVRDQLRLGATHIKLFVSGGVLSPTDPIWMNQYSPQEIRAAVEEAATRRTYVMAHAHTNEAVIRCLKEGVRTIEHATMLEADGAQAIVAHKAYAVPTLAIGEAIKVAGPRLGLSPAMLDKLTDIEACQQRSLDHLRIAGARVGFGTDLLGDVMPMQSREFILRRAVFTPLEILRQATAVNAEILGKSGELGTIAVGAAADILVIDGNPLEDIAVLEDHARIGLIMRAGALVKNTLS